MNPLTEIIAREIRKCGVIPFAQFMELALYCPVCGYYEKEKDNLGKRGDFFTSVSVGEVFGELLAQKFSEWLTALADNSSRLQLVEAGAHAGHLSRDILTWLRRKRTDLFHRLEYCLVEPSAIRCRWQTETLAEFHSSIRWVSTINELAAGQGICGVIFSNELLDALPVRRLGWDATQRKWFEWGVGLEGQRFVWRKIETPAADIELTALPPTLLAALPDGFTTESGPAAVGWWREAAIALRKGKLMTIDYGLTAEEFFLPERSQGTLRAYHRHHLMADLLANVGDQDITAHVNFSAIIAAGESIGLRTESFQTQAQFLTAILACGEAGKSFDEWNTKRTRQFQTLTHPEHMGRTFRVLVQERSTD